MDNSLDACPWEPIRDFQALSEFNKFQDWMADQIREGRAEEIPVEPEFKGNYWSPRWYKHKGSGQIWRLAGPDGPFHGAFEPLVLDLLERFCYLLGQAGQERWGSVINDAVFALREPDFSAGYNKARCLYQGLIKTGNGLAGVNPPTTAELKALRDRIAVLFN